MGLPKLFDPCASYLRCPRSEDPDSGCHTCARNLGEHACWEFVRRMREAAGLPTLVRTCPISRVDAQPA